MEITVKRNKNRYCSAI